MNELTVHVNDRLVGLLREDKTLDEIDFEYLAHVDDAHTVSLLMPPGADPEEYRHYIGGLPPPFEVSLPEGAVMDAIRRRYAKLIDIDNDFELLRLVGRNTVGRVTFGGPREIDASLNARILKAARSDAAAHHLQEILTLSPQASGLSGVMPKVSLSLSLGRNNARQRGTMIGDSAIVKFDAPEYTGASLVEFACLKACSRVGLHVPNTELSHDRTSLIVGRFDVASDGSRLGFEDACALSGLRRTGKYRGSVEHLFRMLEHFVADEDQAAERKTLLRMLIMSDVLRNGDAHLKNFGLTYGSDSSRPLLAPVYDVLTTPTWLPGDLPALPLLASVAGPGSWLDARSLEALGAIAGLDDLDLLAIHRNSREAAMSALSEVLDNVPASPERNALADALAIVEAGAAAWSERRRPRTRTPEPVGAV